MRIHLPDKSIKTEMLLQKCLADFQIFCRNVARMTLFQIQESAVVEWLASDFENGCPGFDPQSRHYGHGGVPLGKAHFLVLSASMSHLG